MPEESRRVRTVKRFGGNKNYKKGRRFEYRVMEILRGKGYFCMRAYASKGPYDVIAIRPANQMNPVPLLIQCKTNGKLPKKEREKLIDLDKKWHGTTVHAYRTGRITVFEDLNSNKLDI